MKLRVFSLAYPVTSLGPGNRIVLWVAGCDRGCPGCVSPEMQPRDAGHEIEVERLAAHIGALPVALDGMTLSGGEIFDQASAAARLINLLREQHKTWTFIAYTGYYLEDLSDSNAQSLLDCLDVVIDGPYDASVPPKHALAGSGNQRAHALTAAGKAMMPSLESPWSGALNLGLGATDFSMLIGVASGAEREAVLRKLGIDENANDTECAM